MPDLLISRGVKRRELGSPRRFDLFNMFLERDETSPDGFSRQSRTGLVPYATTGDGPIAGLYSRPGVFSGDLFTVSLNKLYRGNNLIGGIPGTGPVSFAASASELVVTRGGNVYSYNGTDLQQIEFPDSADVAAVAYLNGYFVFVRAGTHKIYWSASGNGRSVDGLDFASAESAPDPLLDIYVVNDGLWLMGSETVEFWQYAGAADAPFARVEGILLKKGLRATGAAAELDNTLFWWGHDDAIYRAGQGAPLRVSDEAIEERLEESFLKDVFSLSYKGHDLLAVRTDTGTFLYDVGASAALQAPCWCEWGTYGRTGWRAQVSAVLEDVLLLGDDSSSTIWRFDDQNWDDGDHLERRLTAAVPRGPIVINKLCVEGNPGSTTLLTGQGADPMVEMRSSLDQGRTWGPYRATSLGAQGKYRQRIEKRRWGLFSDKGGMFELRCSDPVPFRVTRVYANDPGGGR